MNRHASLLTSLPLFYGYVSHPHEIRHCNRNPPFVPALAKCTHEVLPTKPFSTEEWFCWPFFCAPQTLVHLALRIGKLERRRSQVVVIRKLLPLHNKLEGVIRFLKIHIRRRGGSANEFLQYSTLKLTRLRRHEPH